MGAKYTAVRGMHDILPPASALWQELEQKARTIFERFGYAEIRTPLLEETELFARSIGDSTDIVEKEMYTFQDRKGKSMSLRPEGTASVVRALLEAGWLSASMDAGPVHRLYYLGPMFRYERPQKGRQRQFYQLGVEAFGDGSPLMDVEVLALGQGLIEELGLENHTQLEINTLGSRESRPKYLQALRAFFEKNRGKLCEECGRRLERNAMRILDCKNPACAEIAQQAPAIAEFLDAESTAHFAAVQKNLQALGIKFTVNPRLVRGLDYYTRTSFEFLTQDLGAQGAVLAGGRYDGLVSELGGPTVPAVGFAAGIERLALLLEIKAGEPRVLSGPALYLAGLGEAALEFSLLVAQGLRKQGVSAQTEFRGKSLKSHLKQADRLKAKFVLIVGDAELASKAVNLKEMATGEQESLAFSRPEELIKKILHRVSP